MDANAFAQLDEYGLRHLGDILYHQGTEFYAKLYKITTSPGWYEVHGSLDPSYQAYINNLEWAFKAAENDTDGLSILPMVSFLQTTVRTNAGKIPTEALTLLSRLENFQQAQAYAEVRLNELEKCEDLTKLALSAWEEGNISQARSTLEQAERIAISDQTPRTQAQALGMVAKCAKLIEHKEAYSRSSQALTGIIGQQAWPFAQHLRNFDLIYQTDYVLAVLDMDRKNYLQGFPTNFFSEDAIPIIVGIAAEKKDFSLLGKIISKYKHSILTSIDIAAALTKAGCLKEALEIVQAQHQSGMDTLSIREAIARAAGEIGDIEMIEQIAKAKLLPVEPKQNQSDEYLYLEDRVEHFKDWLGEKAENTLKRAGGGILGLDWEHMLITIAGVEGLLENDPQKGKILWDRIKRDSSKIGKKIAGEAEAVLFGQSGNFSEKDRSELFITRLMNFASKSAGWTIGGKKFWDLEGTGADDMLAELVEMKVNFGDVRGATADLNRIKDKNKHHDALLALVQGTCRLKQFEQACDLAGEIDHPTIRKKALTTITRALESATLEEIMPTLPRVFALAKFTGDSERLENSPAYDLVVRSLSDSSTISECIRWIENQGMRLNMRALTSLGQIAADHNDLLGADQIISELERDFPQPVPMPLSYSEAITSTDYPFNKSYPLQQVELMAEIVEYWGNIIGPSAPEWHEKARQVYSLIQKRMDKDKNLVFEMLFWPAQARSLSALKDWGELINLLNKLRKSAGSSNWTVDLALVYVAIGLTRTGDYIRPGRDIYPPAVESIHWKQYKSLALAEMADVVLQAPLKEGLFGKGLKSDEVEFRVSALLRQSKQQLGLHESTFKFSSPKRSLVNINLTQSATNIFQSSHSTYATSYNAPPKQVLLETLPKIARIYARHGMIEETKNLPGLAGENEKSVIRLAAIHALSEEGKDTDARELLKECRTVIDLVLGNMVLARRDAAKAVLALDYVIPNLREIFKNSLAFRIFTGVIKDLPADQKEHFIRESLRVGRQYVRNDFMTLLGVLSPLFVSMIGITDWQKSLNKIITFRVI